MYGLLWEFCGNFSSSELLPSVSSREGGSKLFKIVYMMTPMEPRGTALRDKTIMFKLLYSVDPEVAWPCHIVCLDTFIGNA